MPDVAERRRPRLVLEVVWKGVGTADLIARPAQWPSLRSLLSSGAGTLRGDVGSIPLDPAAVLTTIGTGGLPSEHGITGRWIRDDRGNVVRAWSPGSPTSVIATLADDLDAAWRQRPMIGVVAPDASDRGIIGKGWYGEGDHDAAVFAAERRVRLRAIDRLLARGFGADAIPDVLAVVMTGPLRRLDADLRRVVGAAMGAAAGSVMVVVTATGANGVPTGRATEATELVRALESELPETGDLVEAAVPGGLFLDRGTLSAEGVSGSVVVERLLSLARGGQIPPLADAFQAFAVSLGRYC